MRPSRRLERWCLERLRHGPTVVEPRGLDRLTVVVPSFGRPEFVLRQFVYWSGTAARLLILDGSPDPIPESVQEEVDARTELDYIHRSAPSWLGLTERLHEARDLIRTAYTVLGGDDEFFLRRGLAEAIGVLDDNPAIVACMGQSLGFVPSSDGRHMGFGPGYPHRGIVNTDPDVRQRLLVAMSRYNAITCYAVTRTDTWRETWGEILDWSSVYAAEMQHAIASWLSGGLIAVDEIYWLRSGENASVRDVTGPHLTFADWWGDPIHAAEVSRFQGLLADHAVAVGAADPSSAPGIVSEAIEVFVHQKELDRVARLDETAPTPRRGVADRISDLVRGLLGRMPSSVRAPLWHSGRHLLRILRRGRESGGVRIDSLVDEGLLPADSRAIETQRELHDVERIVGEFYRVR